MLTRRNLLERAALTGLAVTIARAHPLVAPVPAVAADLPAGDPAGTLQAFADTVIPGRRVPATELGHPVHPAAIAGVDPLPGAVETDALALYRHPLTGFATLEPAFLADLEARSSSRGGDFLSLGFDDRVEVCKAGFDFGNPQRILWEAAAAVPFTAFCAAALVEEQTAAKAAGYRVMGLPGAAPQGYPRGFSYGRRLARERTRGGNLR